MSTSPVRRGNGHPIPVAHNALLATLGEENQAEVIRHLARGTSGGEIARLFGISRQRVHQIRERAIARGLLPDVPRKRGRPPKGPGK